MRVDHCQQSANMVAMSDPLLCPFSKPIIGHWCACPHARLAERCSGKMACDNAADLRPDCIELVSLLRRHSRFVLGLAEDISPLSHAQSMKIRCGGLLGMQRVLQASAEKLPSVPELIAESRRRYGQLSAFPCNEIARDIREFSHRSKSAKA